MLQNSSSIAGKRGIKHEALTHALRGAKAPKLAGTERSSKGLFAFWSCALDDMGRKHSGTWFMPMDGFSVMRSPEGAIPRMAQGSQGRRLWIDLPDAPMPRLREAEKLSAHHRVSFASPSTVHQEAPRN